MGKITVVGLGPGAAGYLSCETMDLLKNSSCVILRTAVHPTVSALKAAGIAFTACDDLYESGSSFEEVYAAIVKRLVAAAERGPVLYAVPGSPLVAEKTVVLLREKAKEEKFELEIRPSMSFLDLAYVKLALDPVEGLRLIDAQDLAAAKSAAGNYPLIITQVYNQFVAGDLKLALMEVLADESTIYFLRNLGLPDEECRALKLYELDREAHIDHLTSIYVPPLKETAEEMAAMAGGARADEAAEIIEEADEELEEDYTDIQPLVDVMKILKAPDGCPWDREQTHESIRSNMIEEVYEYLEAVDNKDIEGMREELGDILMQVVFHACLAEGNGYFNMQDVIDTVVDKLIRRHPHVFGSVHAENSAEALSSWEAVKQGEKKERTHVLDGIYHGLPTLMRAYKLQNRAAKVGFDWPDAKGVWGKIEEELAEFAAAVKAGDSTEMEKEFGDVLFALVNYARHKNIQPEAALNGTNNRFFDRFGYVERCVRERGGNWQDFTLAELDKFWDEAKKEETTRKG